MGTLYNPGTVDISRPHVKVRLTDFRRYEVEVRLVTTSENPTLPDWGWLEGHNLCIVTDDDAALDAGIRHRHSDLRTVMHIFQDNGETSRARSIKGLVRKVLDALDDAGIETDPQGAWGE